MNSGFFNEHAPGGYIHYTITGSNREYRLVFRPSEANKTRDEEYILISCGFRQGDFYVGDGRHFLLHLWRNRKEYDSIEISDLSPHNQSGALDNDVIEFISDMLPIFEDNFYG